MSHNRKTDPYIPEKDIWQQRREWVKAQDDKNTQPVKDDKK